MNSPDNGKRSISDIWKQKSTLGPLLKQSSIGHVTIMTGLADPRKQFGLNWLLNNVNIPPVQVIPTHT